MKMGATRPQVREYWWPSQAGEDKEWILLCRFRRACGPADSFIFSQWYWSQTSGLQNGERFRFCVSKPPRSFVLICHSGHREPIYPWKGNSFTPYFISMYRNLTIAINGVFIYVRGSVLRYKLILHNIYSIMSCLWKRKVNLCVYINMDMGAYIDVIFK